MVSIIKQHAKLKDGSTAMYLARAAVINGKTTTLNLNLGNLAGKTPEELNKIIKEEKKKMLRGHWNGLPTLSPPSRTPHFFLFLRVFLLHNLTL